MRRGKSTASRRSSLPLMWVLGALFWCLVCVLRGESDPFLRPYVLALDSLRDDGDLLLTVPLRKWRLDDETDIDVVLAHRQESLEYGEVRSRFDLLPFQTSVMPAAGGAWVWLRPGGGTVRFEPPRGNSTRGTAQEGTSKKKADKMAKASWEVFTHGRTRLTILWPEKSQIIEDGGWVLSYQCGAINALKAPSGRQFIVTSVGRNITRVSENNVLRAEVVWSPLNLPIRLWLDGEMIHFKTDDAGMIDKVTTEAGDTLAGFAYHRSQLLASIARPGFSEQAFEWQLLPDFTRGDSLYRKPYAVRSAGEVRYGYYIRRDVIHLSSESANQAKRLKIGMQYGKVKWVSEEEPKPSQPLP